MKGVREDIEAIAQLFNLGSVTGIRSGQSNIDGYDVAVFSTEKERDLKYYYTTKKEQAN